MRTIPTDDLHGDPTRGAPRRARTKADPADDLSRPLQTCLRTIYELTEEGAPALRARVIERLGVTGATVSQTITALQCRGLVDLDIYRHLRLTRTGLLAASRVMRKHRLAECFLTTVVGMSLAHAHAEACSWQQVMSAKVERRLFELLERPQNSPFGNPIPALNELGDRHRRVRFLDGVQRLSDASRPTTGAFTGRVRRIGEFVQQDPLLIDAISQAGILPGANVTVHREHDTVLVTHGEHSLRIDTAMTGHIFIAA